jgi:hypothetical protein
MERYPENTLITIEDFRRSSWRTAIEAPKNYGPYYSLWQSFSDLARQAVVNGDNAAGKVLWLLADAFSLMLNPDSRNEPFRPQRSMATGRSALPDDFDDQTLDLFQTISEEVSDLWVRARLSDLLWVRRRRFPSALLAIDAYRGMPLDPDTWVQGTQDSWKRCLSLTITLGAGAGGRLAEIENILVGRFRSAERGDIILALGISELLLTHRLAEGRAADLGGKLEAWARLLSGEGKYYHARPYYAAAIAWFELAKDTAKVWDLTAEFANSFVDEAKSHNSQAVATGLYEKALQTYRQIPKAERDRLAIDARIEHLRVDITVAGRNALGEMKRISASTDISALVEQVQSHMKGKTAIEALRAFANIYSGVKVAALRDRCIKKVTDYPLSTMFGETHFSLDGRVVGKRSGITSGEPDAEAALRAEMVNMYQMELVLHVRGTILPALEVVTLEHRLGEHDFIWFARQSPVIPAGRELLYGRGLFLGYDLDFATAVHLLVPQIENIVRLQLKARGAITSTIDQEGIETENGLSALVKLPQMTQCFGEDLTFELSALFCDSFGPNLRNCVAHGLLDFEASRSVPSIYAWWLSFRLMFSIYRLAANPPAEDSASKD